MNMTTTSFYQWAIRFSKQNFTHIANKAFWVPMLTQSSNVVVHDWLLTSTTFRGKCSKVIITTEWLPISLVKARVSKWLATLMAEEVLLMPSFIQGSHTRLNQKGKLIIAKMHLGESPSRSCKHLSITTSPLLPPHQQ